VAPVLASPQIYSISPAIDGEWQLGLGPHARDEI
jgi:hypothetical protein